MDDRRPAPEDPRSAPGRHADRVLEVANDGDEPKENDFVQSDLVTAEVEERCDEVERLYLWGDAGAVGLELHGPEKPVRHLRVVTEGERA